MCYYQRVGPTILTLFMAFASGLLFLSSPRAAWAQTQTPQDMRRAEMESRQRALWNLERVKRRLSQKTPEQHLSMQQIKEDFEQLQVTNYNLFESVRLSQTLDYRQIKKDSGEIRKRAARLKDNLSLPDPEKEERRTKVGDSLPAEGLNKSMIAALDALVKSFAWNPIFQQPGIVDVKNSMKARSELEEIIVLSEQIKKRAEALSKAAEKNP